MLLVVVVVRAAAAAATATAAAAVVIRLVGTDALHRRRRRRRRRRHRSSVFAHPAVAGFEVFFPVESGFGLRLLSTLLFLFFSIITDAAGVWLRLL